MNKKRICLFNERKINLARDKVLSRSLILKNAKKEFLEKGFEKANLREICAQAGVTTGAFYGHFEDKEALFSELVQPVITDIEYHYSLLKQQSFTMYKKETVITKQTIESILDLKLKGAIGMVSYFFDNKDIFELLAFCAYGTKHEHFLDEIIEKYKGKDILITTHNGVTVVMGYYFRKIPLTELVDTKKVPGLKNCEIAEYEVI